MDLATLRSLVTIISLLVFLAICITAYSKRNRASLEAIGRSVLDDDDTPNTRK